MLYSVSPMRTIPPDLPSQECCGGFVEARGVPCLNAAILFWLLASSSQAQAPVQPLPHLNRATAAARRASIPNFWRFELFRQFHVLGLGYHLVVQDGSRLIPRPREFDR
jgi:hypothetical protein